MAFERRIENVVDLGEILVFLGREDEIVLLHPLVGGILKETLLEGNFVQINGVAIESLEDVFVLVEKPDLFAVPLLFFGGDIFAAELQFKQAFLPLEEDISLGQVPELGNQERVFSVVGSVVFHPDSTLCVGVVSPHDFLLLVENQLVSEESQHERLLLEDYAVDFLGEVKQKLLLVLALQLLSKSNHRLFLVSCALVLLELSSSFHYYRL